MDLNLWKRTKRERGLTYQDISATSGIPIGTIKNIFAGYTPDPRESTIKAIEQALGVETRLVYGQQNNQLLNGLTAAEQSLLENFRLLSKTEKEQVSEYAALLAEKHEK